MMVTNGPDLEEIRQPCQHVCSNRGNVIDALAVFQEDPDEQQDCPAVAGRALSARHIFHIFSSEKTSQLNKKIKM